MLEIDVLLTEQRLTEEFLAGLEDRYLAEKFFYWFPLSVKAWLDLCQKTQPYPNYSRSFQLVSTHAGEIARWCSSTEVEVIGLGAGQGDKDLVVLDAFRRNGRTVRYRPVDSSQALLEMAVSRAREAGFQVRGLKADVEDPRTGELLNASAIEPRLYLVLGNSLGIIDPVKFLTLLVACLRPEDHLLLDGEIYSPQMTIQGYDNPVNRWFAFAPLASLGLEEGSDGSLVFESREDTRYEGLHLVGKHFVAARELRILVAGHWVELRAGEKIEMNGSWKYSAEGFLNLLEKSGGFKPLQKFPSHDERFLMVLAGRSEGINERVERQ